MITVYICLLRYMFVNRSRSLLGIKLKFRRTIFGTEFQRTQIRYPTVFPGAEFTALGRNSRSPRRTTTPPSPSPHPTGNATRDGTGRIASDRLTALARNVVAKQSFRRTMMAEISYGSRSERCVRRAARV